MTQVVLGESERTAVTTLQRAIVFRIQSPGRQSAVHLSLQANRDVGMPLRHPAPVDFDFDTMIEPNPGVKVTRLARSAQDARLGRLLVCVRTEPRSQSVLVR